MKTKQKIYNLLRKSQKYTRTDMVYLAKGGFWLTLGQVVSTIASFLSAIAFANLLPREVYGQYKYILSVASILAIPTLSGMNTAITQAVARGYEGSFIPALKTRIKWGLLGGLASLGLAGYYFFNGNITLTISFLVAAIFLPFMDSFNVYGALLIGKKRFDLSTKISVPIRIISIAVMIVVLFLTNNLFLILITYFISNTLLRFIALMLTLKKFKLNKKEDPETLSYGKHLSLIGIIGTIATNIDKILLWHLLGATEVAMYYIATAPIEQIRSFIKNVRLISLPKFSTKELKKLKKTAFQKSLKLFFAICFIVSIYIIFSPLLFKVAFPIYENVIIYSQIYALSLITMPTIIFNTIFLAKRAKKQIFISNIIAPFVRIILLVPFIYFFGFLGVFLAIIIYKIFVFFLEVFLFINLTQNS